METTNRDEWEHVGPYRIHNRIGSGGYAEVFAGVDTRSGQRVALKRLRLKHTGDKDSRERFRREGLALEAIDHPNIVRCFGVFVEEDDVWIVMELLKGFSLRQFLRDRGPLSVERALIIAIDVADGLADMHEMAIVHRDLKPENVFLSMPGFVVKVVDLGVAKFHGWSVPTTDPGLLVCTPSYAAPEMSMGYAVDARSDIYALGLVLYEMLIGRNPFANGDGTLPRGQDALTAHIVRTPPLVSSRRPDVPEHVAKLVAQMMAKDPVDRPPAMKVVARELRRTLRAIRQGHPRSSRPSLGAAARALRTTSVRIEARSEARSDSVRRPAAAFTAMAPNGAATAVAARLPDVARLADASPVAGRVVARRPDPARAPDAARLFLLPPIEPSETVDFATTPPCELCRPAPAGPWSAITGSHPRAHQWSALGLVLVGTMLIGGACGVVLWTRLWNLPHAPAASSLYAVILAGALVGTAGALLIQDRDETRAPARGPRPSAWILAIGIAAGLLLGAAATWLFVSPVAERPCSAEHAIRRPS